MHCYLRNGEAKQQPPPTCLNVSMTTDYNRPLRQQGVCGSVPRASEDCAPVILLHRKSLIIKIRFIGVFDLFCLKDCRPKLYLRRQSTAYSTVHLFLTVSFYFQMNGVLASFSFFAFKKYCGCTMLLIITIFKYHGIYLVLQDNIISVLPWYVLRKHGRVVFQYLSFMHFFSLFLSLCTRSQNNST